MTLLRSSCDLQAPVCRPLHIHLQLRIVRLEVAIIRRRARHEPYIRIACRQNPAFPEPGLIKRLLVRGVVRLVLRGRRGQARLLVCRNRGAQSFRSFSAEQMIAGREQSVILRIAVPARSPASHSRWLGLPIAAHTIRFCAMSAVATFASMVEALTSGAVRNARNPNCSSICPRYLW